MDVHKAFDGLGKELTPCEINSLCPIAFRAEASRIALDYFTEVEKCEASIEQMFSVLLKPIGENEPTHCWCPRKGFTSGLESQLSRMKSLSLEWVGSREYTLEDDRSELLSKFVCMTNNAVDILRELRLEVVAGQ